MRRGHRADIWWDVLIFVLFCAIGGLLGRNALLAQGRAGRAPAFYQNWLGAALYETCGQGFAEPPWDRWNEPLTNFLTLKTDSISCADLPPNVPLRAADPYARMHRYLAGTLTLLWKLRGIRWSALGPVFEIFCGLVAGLTYAVFRLGLNRWWSIAGAGATAASGLNLFYLHKLRDYSKAPFLLAGLLILGSLAARPTTTHRLLTLSGLFGAIIGLGLGFRTDVVIAIPLFLLLIVFLLPTPQPAWRVKAAALLLFAAGVGVTGWPVVNTYGHGSNTPHVTLLGYTEVFSDILGLERTDYLVNQLYGDRPIEWAARNYELVTVGPPAWSTTSSVNYDRLAGRYLSAVMRLLPADTVIHAYAAILRVFQLPFSAPGQQDCESLRPSLAATVCHARNLVVSPLAPLGPLAVLTLIVVTFALNPRLGLFLGSVVCVYVASTMLQFDPRHVFYLEFTSLWALAFLAQRVTVPWQAWRQGQWRAPAARAVLWRGAAALVALIVIPGIVLIAARAWQQRTLDALFTRYLAAETDPVPITPGAALLPLEHLLPPLEPFDLRVADRPTLRSALLRLEFGGPGCAGHGSYVTLRYEVPFNGKLANQTVTLQWSVPANGAPMHIFVPAYRMLIAVPGLNEPMGELRLLDLDMMPDEAHCLRSLSTVRRPADFPISLIATLGPDWRSHRLYQTLSNTGAQNSPHPGFP